MKFHYKLKLKDLYATSEFLEWIPKHSSKMLIVPCSSLNVSFSILFSRHISVDKHYFSQYVGNSGFQVSLVWTWSRDRNLMVNCSWEDMTRSEFKRIHLSTLQSHPVTHGTLNLKGTQGFSVYTLLTFVSTKNLFRVAGIEDGRCQSHYPHFRN